VKNYIVTIRRNGGAVGRIFKKTIQASCHAEVHAIVDHWNENEDFYFFEILSIEV